MASIPASTPITSSVARRSYLFGMGLAILGAILFSCKAIVAKLLYRHHIDPVTLLAFRMLFALPFFAAAAFWQAAKARNPLSFGDLLRISIMGLLGYYVSSYVDFIGLQYISAGLERLILFLTPTIVLLISALVLKRRISSLEWTALALSYAGIVLVFWHDVHSGGSEVILGSAFVLGSAISYSVYLLMSGQMVARVGALRLVAYAMCAASAGCILQFFLLRPPSLLLQPAPVYALSAFNAVFCTVLPVFMTMLAVARIGAPSAAQAGMAGPVSTLFLGALILGEPITAIQLAGTALVLSGIYLLSKKKL